MLRLLLALSLGLGRCDGLMSGVEQMEGRRLSRVPTCAEGVLMTLCKRIGKFTDRWCTLTHFCPHSFLDFARVALPSILLFSSNYHNMASMPVFHIGCD